MIYASKREAEWLNHVMDVRTCYDKLFDKGLISFTNDKRLLISKDLSLKNQINILKK